MQWTKDSIEICWTHFRAFSEISFVLPPAMAVYCLSFTLNSTADFSICKVAIGFIKIRWSFNFFSIWKWKKKHFLCFWYFISPNLILDYIQSFLAISLEISDSKFCIFKCHASVGNVCCIACTNSFVIGNLFKLFSCSFGPNQKEWVRNIHLKCDKRHVNHSETLHRTT